MKRQGHNNQEPPSKRHASEVPSQQQQLFEQLRVEMLQIKKLNEEIQQLLLPISIPRQRQQVIPPPSFQQKTQVYLSSQSHQQHQQQLPCGYAPFPDEYQKPVKNKIVETEEKEEKEELSLTFAILDDDCVCFIAVSFSQSFTDN
jgi:hypothetical protein